MEQRSAADALRARLATSPATAWRPDRGEANPLVGTVESIGERVHETWGRYPTVTVVAEDGDRRCWHAWGAVARQQLDATRPQRGDLVAVSFDGERVGAAGRPYKVWRVEVERAPERRFDDDVAQAPRLEPFPWPEGEGPGGAA